MKKLICFFLIGCILSGCSLFRVHKTEIEQGNIIIPENVRRLHPGMSEFEVKDIMGTPMLINIFSPNRMDYVYTFQAAYEPMQEHRVTCIFKNHILKDVIES